MQRDLNNLSVHILKTSTETSSKQRALFWSQVTKWTFLTCLGITVIFPLIWVIFTSLKTFEEYMKNSPWALPRALNFTNYQYVLKDPFFLRSTFYSVLIAVVSVALLIFLGAMAGYIIARYKSILIQIISIVILGALMIPIHMVLMPLFVLSRQMGVLSSPWAVIGPYVAFGIPFSVFIFRGFFINIPGTLVEAAKIDGATETGVFFKVMLPNTKPAMATVLIFQFLAAWNEFLFALVLLQDQKSYTLPLELTNFQGQYTANYPVLAAGLFMACMPGLLLYGFFNKVVIRGMAEGAIKG